MTALLSFFTYTPYLVLTIKGKIKPHPLTWIIWTLICSIAFAAQISDNAGPGAWANAATLIVCFLIIPFSFKHGFKDITKFDILIFSLSLGAIPLWIFTENALFAVVLVTLANYLAYLPAVRKFYSKPFDETTHIYSLNVAKHGLSIFALDNLSLITALYPVSLVFSNISFAIFLYIRRAQLKQTTTLK